jgi:hypothetical protein
MLEMKCKVKQLEQQLEEVSDVTNSNVLKELQVTVIELAFSMVITGITFQLFSTNEVLIIFQENFHKVYVDLSQIWGSYFQVLPTEQNLQQTFHSFNMVYIK